MFKFLLFLLIPLAFADRGTLNGGGLAEMKAISIHLRLRDWMAPCLHQPSTCGLGDSHALTDLGLAIRMSTPDRLVIEPGLSVRFSTEPRVGAVVKIATRELYEENGLPKPSGEIAALLLEALASQVGADAEFARVLTAGLTEDGARYTFTARPKLEISSWNVGLHGQHRMFLFLEDAAQTLDLGAQLPQLGTCQNVTLQNWRNLHEDGITTLIADVTSLCDGVAAYQTLLISIRLNSQGLIEPQSLTIHLRESI